MPTATHGRSAPSRRLPRNFSEIIRHHAEQHGDTVFCHDLRSGETLTFGELDARVSQGCQLLRALGVAPGDRISLCLENSLSFVILYFSAIRFGAGVNPLPYALSAAEIRKQMALIEPRVAFLDSRHAAADAVHEAGQVFDLGAGHRRLAEALHAQPRQFDPYPGGDTAACFYYSSGTTTDPKCVMYSHRNMVALADSICRGFSFTADTVHLGFLPLGHTAITNYQMLPAVYGGSRLILCESFMKIRPRFWQLVARFGVTYVEVVPTVLVTMLHTPYTDAEVQANGTLRFIGCGSAPLPLDVQVAFQKKYRVPVANLYGLSETGPSHFDDPLRAGWRAGSIGTALDVNECVILREDKTRAVCGEIGEIALRGDNVFVGYHKNPAAYAAVLHDGFFLTGDLGYQDAAGHFYFVDRKKDLIIKGGVNIFPGEVEEILYQIAGVQTAAVVGVPDAVFGEEVVAYVTPREGARLAEDDILRFCREQLHLFKCPKRVCVVDEIPVGPSGKLLKRELRRRFAEGA